MLKFKNKKILLLTHENADLDALTSAAIFKEFLKLKKIDAKIAVPSHINEQTLSFALNEKVSFIINPNLDDFETICLFDFNDYEQLGYLKNKFKKVQKTKTVIAFDHHEKEKRSISTGFIDSKKLSTTELLFDVIGKSFTPKMSAYACIGMIEDTGRFLVGEKKFFNSFAKCLEKSSFSYAMIFEIAKHKMPQGEQIAFLKAIKRAKLTKINHVTVVTSNISFYQGAIATKLLEFGGDITLVIGKEKKGTTHLSARAETGFKEKFKFNLMKDLMIPLHKKIDGEVGGHSGAAQWKGNVSEKTVLSLCLKLIEKKVLK